MTRMNIIRLLSASALCMASVIAAAQEPAQAPSDPAADYKRGQSLLWDDLDRSNDAEGVALIRAAADKGSAEAQAYLSTLYGAGLFVEQDSKASFRWAEKAAAQKHPEAIMKLAFAYLHGLERVMHFFVCRVAQPVAPRQGSVAQSLAGGQGKPRAAVSVPQGRNPEGRPSGGAIRRCTPCQGGQPWRRRAPWLTPPDDLRGTRKSA